ncbi:MAG: 50S ribosomal protein L21 [Acidobacteria bacterium]|nr:50S ribosomal protein L21 [Acidobacteriota bacterium]
MYAVIRAGGKQYRVAPGDVIRVESTPAENGTIEFGDILAVSGEAGKIGRPESGARVTGSVVEEGRSDKVLVFHYKRKKQYKKLRGHRQGYTAVRITEIAFDGQTFTAPEAPAPTPKRRAEPAEAESQGASEPAAAKRKGGSRASGQKPAGRKSAAKKGGPAKSAAKKQPKKK